jgi:hypothetical protein
MKEIFTLFTNNISLKNNIILEIIINYTNLLDH